MVKVKNTQDTLRAAEQALQEAIRRQGEMEQQHHQAISEIVHDIKNPLGAMMSFLSLIRQEYAGPLANDTYEKYFKTIDRSANRLMAICEILMAEHLDPVLREPPAKRVDVTELVDEIGDLFAARAKERDIELHTEVASDFPQLEADPEELYRALMNLVSNAVKFTPEGGRVDVQADIDPNDNTFIVVVRDSGVGMTREQIDKIMSSSLTTVSPHGDVGTGQGLGIVNRIVRQYGGKLDIVSTENRGTRIKLKFPKAISF